MSENSVTKKIMSKITKQFTQKQLLEEKYHAYV